MEASERPQLPLDHGPTVRALDDRLVIERLTVEDAGSARVVREQQAEGRSAAETVTRAIEIGTRIIEIEGTAANVDFVRKELEAGLGQLDRKLGDTLDDGAETLAERIAQTFGTDRNDSVQAQIKEIVTSEARQNREQLLATLTAEDGSNPLVSMQVRINAKLLEAEERHRSEVEKLRESHSKESRATQLQVSELKEHLARLLERDEADERVAEEAERGTAKGRSFEARAFAAIEAIASGRDDVAHHVGDEAAAGGGKRGDVVVELDAASGAPAGRIVFEVKDERLGRRDAWGILNEAMEQRQADFGVLVVAGAEKIPAQARQLHQYEGNKLVVAVDRDEPGGVELEAAYCLSRALVRARRDASLEVDAAGVVEAAEAIATELGRKQGMKRTLTGIANSAQAVGDGLDEMDAAIKAQIAAIESLIAAAETEA